MKKILLAILAIIIGSSIAISPAFATCPKGCVATNILEGTTTGTQGEKCACGSDGVKQALKMAIRIFTVAVGVLAAIGITIVGIQYLTAGGNEEQAKKAKRRLFEIVIGIVAFVLMFAILTWLLPGFSPSEIWS